MAMLKNEQRATSGKRLKLLHQVYEIAIHSFSYKQLIKDGETAAKAACLLLDIYNASCLDTRNVPSVSSSFKRVQETVGNSSIIRLTEYCSSGARAARRQMWMISTEYDFATPKAELPLWLKRLERYSEEDAMIHLDWLEYALLEEGFTFEEVFEVIQAVKRTSDGDVARTVGAIDFLRLILQLNEDGDMFCTKQVLLASVLHFSDCITVRETGVYEMVRRAVHGKTRQTIERYLLRELIQKQKLTMTLPGH